jgi:UTP--glucose-1-phosphate uridylyltransferase
MRRVRKGVIPAAGLGTRLCPMTKVQPKEMLPVGGRPMIYYAILEAGLAEIEEIYVVLNKSKDSLRLYLVGGALEKDLLESGEKGSVRPPHITFIDQPVPLGSGDAIYRTKDRIGDEPFALMMPDFILFGSRPALGQMIPLSERFKRDIIGVLELGPGEAGEFGNVGLLRVAHLEEGIVEVHDSSDKSKEPLILEEKETVFKLAGRWILGPHFFSYLRRTKGGRAEWDDTPAFQALCKERKVIGKILEGTGFDVGNPIGYGLARKRFGEVLGKSICKSDEDSTG